MKTRARFLLRALVLALGAQTLGGCGGAHEDATADESEIRGGSPSYMGAVGMVNGGSCTGSLISQFAVLTAAHCVCNGPGNCVAQANFTFINAPLASNPNVRQNVTLTGNVIVHPQFGAGGWQTNDFAIIKFTQPISQSVAATLPLKVESPSVRPAVGDPLILVGFGKAPSYGQPCTQPGASSGQQRTVTVRLAGYTNFTTPNAGANLIFRDNIRGSCPGDSGGPAFDWSWKIVGVASSGDVTTTSNYRATFAAWDFISTNACYYGALDGNAQCPKLPPHGGSGVPN